MELRRRTKAAVLSLLIATATLSACGSDTDAELSAVAPAQVSGRWSSSGNTLPVMSLELTQAGPTLSGYLRLSGVEVPVTGTVTGSDIRLEDARIGTTNSFRYIVTARLENETTMKAGFDASTGPVSLTLTRQ